MFFNPILNTLPKRGAYYRIGACPYLSGTTFFCPCKGRRVQYHNELCAPYRGKVCVKHETQGQALALYSVVPTGLTSCESFTRHQ